MKPNLCDAVRKNDVEAVRKILEKNPKASGRSSLAGKSTEKQEKSPLWEAMILGHAEIVKLLIEHGADANERQKVTQSNRHYKDNTFLQFVARYKGDWEKHKAVVEILIHDAKVRLEEALQTAIMEGKPRYVEFLLQNGASLNDPEYCGSTPHVLGHAPKSLQRSLLQLLIKYGMDARYRDEETGYDYLVMAMEEAEYHPDEIDIVGIAKVLIDSGLPINRKDKAGVPILTWALQLGNCELVALLIDAGADVNEILDDYFPLSISSMLGDVELVKLLISKGADVNAKVSSGCTSLHVACGQRHEEVIRVLLQNGADTSMMVENGDTPFSFLLPQNFEESRRSCITAMVREIVRLKFLNDPRVSKKDLDLMQAHPEVQKIYQNFTEELDRMTIFKFYDPYTYYFVLSSKNRIERLANLTRNEDFVLMFEKNLQEFPNYKDELQSLMDEAIKVKNRSLIVESRLKSVFELSFPGVVVKKLAKILTVEDLPLKYC